MASYAIIYVQGSCLRLLKPLKTIENIFQGVQNCQDRFMFLSCVMFLSQIHDFMKPKRLFVWESCHVKYN